MYLVPHTVKSKGWNIACPCLQKKRCECRLLQGGPLSKVGNVIQFQLIMVIQRWLPNKGKDVKKANPFAPTQCSIFFVSSPWCAFTTVSYNILPHYHYHCSRRLPSGLLHVGNRCFFENTSYKCLLALRFILYFFIGRYRLACWLDLSL